MAGAASAAEDDSKVARMAAANATLKDSLKRERGMHDAFRDQSKGFSTTIKSLHDDLRYATRKLFENMTEKVRVLERDKKELSDRAVVTASAGLPSGTPRCAVSGASAVVATAAAGAALRLQRLIPATPRAAFAGAVPAGPATSNKFARHPGFTPFSVKLLVIPRGPV